MHLPLVPEGFDFRQWHGDADLMFITRHALEVAVSGIHADDHDSAAVLSFCYRPWTIYWQSS
jgi:hypothetical protein